MKAAVLLLAVASGLAEGQTVNTLVDHGDAANRIDLVVLGDGYTADEAGKFTADATRFLASFFGGEVYREYAGYFNVRTVTVASNQSGASHPELNPPAIKDTAFNASYNCAGVARLICVNNAKVTALLNPLLPANQRDFAIVLVNDPVYGGAGGSIIVSSLHTSAVEIGLHESGHTIGLLADEYTDQPPMCNLNAEPTAANATKVTDRANVKWNAWIAPATAVPTTVPAPSQAGLYEGCDYCPSGKYRPTYNSKMRTLGYPFDPINDEQLVRRFYNLVSGIDSFSPTSPTVTAVQGTKAEFRVTPLAPASHPLKVAWTVDGAAEGSGVNLTVDTSKLSEGVHSIRVQVRDVTDWVRTDLANLLSDSQTWQLTVTPGAPASLASLTVTPSTVIAGAIATVSFTFSGPVLVGSPLSASFASNNAAFPVPSNIALEPGQTGGSFAVRASPGVTAPVTIAVSVSYNGSSRSFNVTVTPPPGLKPAIGAIMGAGLSVPAVRVLASGGLFSVFGSDFVAGSAARTAGAADLVGGALPANLAQTCLQVGNARAPLTFVSATQINAVSPVAGGSGSVPVSVIAECGTANQKVSEPMMMAVGPAAPEFLYFGWNADGRNPVAAIQATTGAYVGIGAAARPGDVLTIFGVGFGATTSNAPPGTIAAAAVETLIPAKVTIGGVPAQVLYAGVTPGFAGLYQVNLIVPEGVAAGAQPIVIEVNGGTSPAGAYLTAGQ